MVDEVKYKEFERYIASGEPGVEERARNWSMAIGLQDVDRLKPSEFLLEQAKANIEGRTSHHKNIMKDIQPLERFMNFAVFGIPADLRNRTLHIHWMSRCDKMTFWKRHRRLVNASQ